MARQPRCARDAAEGAPDARHACVWRHVGDSYARGMSRPRPEPAGRAGCAARRGQRRRGGRRLRAQPVGDEPTAGAAARGDRRSTAGQVQDGCWCRRRARASYAIASTLVRSAEACCDPPTADRLEQARAHVHAPHQRRLRRDFGPALIARVRREAPGVRLRFLQKPDKDSGPLRDGRVDLETGVIDQATGGEVIARRRCSATASSASCAPGTPGRGRSHRRALRGDRPRRVSRRGLAHDQVRSRRSHRSGCSATSSRSSVASRPRSPSRGPRTWSRPCRSTTPRPVCAPGMHSFALPFADARRSRCTLLWHPRIGRRPGAPLAAAVCPRGVRRARPFAPVTGSSTAPAPRIRAARGRNTLTSRGAGSLSRREARRAPRPDHSRTMHGRRDVRPRFWPATGDGAPVATTTDRRRGFRRAGASGPPPQRV
jgi:hypothetical protein